MSVLVQVFDLSGGEQFGKLFVRRGIAGLQQAIGNQGYDHVALSAFQPRLSAGVNERMAGTRQRMARQERDAFIAVPTGWERGRGSEPYVTILPGTTGGERGGTG